MAMGEVKYVSCVFCLQERKRKKREQQTKKSKELSKQTTCSEQYTLLSPRFSFLIPWATGQRNHWHLPRAKTFKTFKTSFPLSLKRRVI